MAWFTRSKKNIEKNQQREMPDGLWTNCPSCNEVIYKMELEEDLFTCSNCDYHFRVGTKEYIRIILDPGSFKETHKNVKPTDPLEFVDTKKYPDRIEAGYKKSKMNEAMTTGTAKIHGKEISFASMNFNYIGGSMGSVVGEKFCRAARLAIDKKMPFLVVCASGGARMQEAAISLMQMAKTSSMVAELGETKIPYIVLLTDPTTGGVTASFAMLGDVTLAEPGALIGFAGPRVIEQTIKKKLPQGFQRSEFLLDKGFIDRIVHRSDLRDTINNVIKWFDN
jgi:acetyl-CoA carboxylase carboxyl transferase subunit beta